MSTVWTTLSQFISRKLKKEQHKSAYIEAKVLLKEVQLYKTYASVQIPIFFIFVFSILLAEKINE